MRIDTNINKDDTNYVLEITKANFQEEVLKSATPVLVDFWATWCGSCQMMLPVVEEIAKEIKGRPLKIAKANVDEVGDLAEEYGVMSVPTFILFKGGKEIARVTGSQTKEKLISLLNT